MDFDFDRELPLQIAIPYRDLAEEELSDNDGAIEDEEPVPVFCQNNKIQAFSKYEVR